MKTVSEILKETDLPALQDRETMVKLLMENEYGYMPEMPYEISVSEAKKLEGRYCCGKAALSRVEFTVTTESAAHTFPVWRLLHDDGKKHPFFVFINFRGNAPDYYYPVEEIVERGFDVLSFNYNDVCKDNTDFTNGIAGMFMPNGQDKPNTCGKITLWAWAASRVMDYAQTLPSLDLNNGAVIGHSRLGKTALVAGMLDERFKYVFSNDSGCSGAALARGNSGLPGQVNYDPDNIYNYERNFDLGETIRDIMMAVPYWFCKNYEKYVTTNMPEGFDQHYLLSSIAPRYAYVASASMDAWACPDSEFMCCVAASEAYKAMGLTGLVHTEELPGDDITLHEGHIGYHRRIGNHFLSRVDWNRYMDYIELHMQDK